MHIYAAEITHTKQIEEGNINDLRYKTQIKESKF